MIFFHDEFHKLVVEKEVIFPARNISIQLSYDCLYELSFSYHNHIIYLINTAFSYFPNMITYSVDKTSYGIFNFSLVKLNKQNILGATQFSTKKKWYMDMR